MFNLAFGKTLVYHLTLLFALMFVACSDKVAGGSTEETSVQASLENVSVKGLAMVSSRYESLDSTQLGQQHVQHLRVQGLGQAKSLSQFGIPFPRPCGGSWAWTGSPRSCGARSARAPSRCCPSRRGTSPPTRPRRAPRP